MSNKLAKRLMETLLACFILAMGIFLLLKFVIDPRIEQVLLNAELAETRVSEVEGRAANESAELKKEISEAVSKLVQTETKVDELGKELNEAITDDAEVKNSITEIDSRLNRSETTSDAYVHVSNTIGLYLLLIAKVTSVSASESGELLGVYTGVAWLVSEEYLLTVRHVALPKDGADLQTEAFFPILDLRVELGKPTQIDDKLALYKLDEESVWTIEHLKFKYFSFASPETIRNSPLTVRLLPTPEGPNLNLASYGKITNLNDESIETCCEDAYKGYSGSPLFVYNANRNRLEVAGITQQVQMLEHEGYLALHTLSTSSERILKFLSSNGVNIKEQGS